MDQLTAAAVAVEPARAPKIPLTVIEDLRGLVEVAVKVLVDHKDAVTCTVVPGAYRLIAELHTDPRDVGQVIGRNGHLMSSLRSFVAALSGRTGVRMDLDFVTEQQNNASRGRAAGR